MSTLTGLKGVILIAFPNGPSDPVSFVNLPLTHLLFVLPAVMVAGLILLKYTVVYPDDGAVFAFDTASSKRIFAYDCVISVQSTIYPDVIAFA